MDAAPATDLSQLFADWPPPYLLEGDSWAFIGLARANRLRAALPEGRPLAFLGWSPVLLQATHYTSARSVSNARAVSYNELSLLTLCSAPTSGWALLPITLLVNDSVSLALGFAYGFPKELADVRVQSRPWNLTALAGAGRSLVAVRGLGAFLLLPLRALLTRVRWCVELPRQKQRTSLHFRAIRRLAPAYGLPSRALRGWTCGAMIFPLGATAQGFELELAPPLS